MWRGPHDLTVVLLAFASGATDVLSFLALIGTFTSAMTGNTALLGLEVGLGRFAAAVRSFSALVGFVIGVAIGTLCGESGGRRLTLLRLLGLEALCLLVFTAIWLPLSDPGHSTIVYLLIILSATGMGLQSVAARRINLPGIPTVVFTTTLTGIVVAATERVVHGKPFPVEAKRQTEVFCAYLFGTLLGGLIASHNIAVLVLLPLTAVLAAFAREYTAPAE